MKVLTLSLALFFSFGQQAMANQLSCKDSNQNAFVYVKSAIIIDSSITLTLKNDTVINGKLVPTNHQAMLNLDEQTSKNLNLRVKLISNEGQNFLMVNPLESMEIPQMLICQ